MSKKTEIRKATTGRFYRVDKKVADSFKAMCIFSPDKMDEVVEKLFEQYAKHGDELFTILKTK